MYEYGKSLSEKRECSEFTEILITRANLQEKQALCIFQDTELHRWDWTKAQVSHSPSFHRCVKISFSEWKLLELYGVCPFIGISPSERLACRSFYVHIRKRLKVNLVFLTISSFSSCNRQTAKEFWKKIVTSHLHKRYRWLLIIESFPPFSKGTHSNMDSLVVPLRSREITRDNPNSSSVHQGTEL